MDWLNIPATGVTAVSLLVITYFAQLRGWFYTKPQVDELRQDRDNRIDEIRRAKADSESALREVMEVRLADKNEIIQNLMEAVAAKEEALSISRAQMSRLLDGIETTAAVVQAIPRSVDSS